jgi:LmbE family N-acetylglucosaminyl deacetylase
MNEAILAMNALGLKNEDLIFLGYPDFGTMDILTEYWDKNRPYSNVLEKISSVPYQECRTPGAPFIGQNILDDLEGIFKDFKPTRIIVSSPADTNRDHQALYLFLRVALLDLVKDIGRPQIYCYLVHIKDWPSPKGLYYDKDIGIPSSIKNIGINWIESYLNSHEIENKSKAVSLYKSQIEYSSYFLDSFVRKNELFSVFNDIKISKAMEYFVNGYAALEPGIIGLNLNDNINSQNPGNVKYKLEDNYLILNLKLKRKIDQAFGISIYLLGYSNAKDFSSMPKLHIDLSIKGLSIKDRFNSINKKDFTYYYQGNELILKIPLDIIGNPDFILSHIKTHSGDITLDEEAWRVLEIQY